MAAKRTRKTPAEPTPESKLRDALANVARLEAELAEAIKRGDKNLTRATTAETQRSEREAKLGKQVDQLTTEGNQLRGMIRNLETELARRAGYMEAIEDAKPKPPPRMIPAPEPVQEHYAEARPDGMLRFDDPNDNGRWQERTRIVKGWWER